VHIIQEHLRYLAEDFDRFQNRMDKLAVHIKQAHDDVDNVNKSAKKISSRFEKIERVELENEKPDVVPIIAVDDQGEIT
ncbi:MAG TPA: DNA recombination protein RmuC, partial [Dehalococcoidia bacterium]|nr:DNA recombination protein RmuC [Dehalococcoidia bacterium]